MMNSNFVACCTGKSAGLAPFKIFECAVPPGGSGDAPRNATLNPSIPDEKAGHRSPQVEPTFQRPADNSAHFLRCHRFQAEGAAADYHHLLTFLDATCFGTGLAAGYNWPLRNSDNQPRRPG